MKRSMKGQKQGGFLISKIHQLSQRIFSRILKESKLYEFNPSQGKIMFVLWQNDNIAIHELVEKTQLGKSTITFHLDNLEKAGHIKRIPSERDKREFYVVLTDKDKELQEKYVNVSQEMTKIFYNKFTENEIQQFETFLERLLDNLIQYEEITKK
ncbi:MAG: MarR family winged helix-turn-helix transcriptional regulator [Candidatus Hodarchaeota archaeon]